MIKYILAIIISASGSVVVASGPCWNFIHNRAPTVPVATFVPMFSVPAYETRIVQEVRFVPVVENVWEYRPILIQQQPQWIYYPMPIYGHIPNPWRKFNY